MSTAWTEFLGQWSWQIFGTVTFANPMPAEAVERHTARWADEFALETAAAAGLARQDKRGRWRGQYVSRRRGGHFLPQWVAGVEPNPSRNGYHAHVLYSLPAILGKPDLSLAWRTWRRRHGSFAKFEKPRDQDAIRSYAAGYAVKNGEVILSRSLKASQ